MAKQVLELVRKQRFRCAISGRELTPETASLDHIVPLARGGRHAIENVWVVDHQVNAAKGTLQLDEFIAMCRDVVAHQRECNGCTGPRKSKDCRESRWEQLGVSSDVLSSVENGTKAVRDPPFGPRGNETNDTPEIDAKRVRDAERSSPDGIPGS